MSSEIEKMYEKAELLYCNKCRHDSELDCIYMCESKYPPFTAEKQIELIKWLVHNTKQIHITDVNSGEFYFAAYKYESYMKVDFDEALASFINNLWQSLTEEEKQQVKRILE